MTATLTQPDDITISDDVSADIWGDGTITLTVAGTELTLTVEQARDALAALGYAVAVSH